MRAGVFIRFSKVPAGVFIRFSKVPAGVFIRFSKVRACWITYVPHYIIMMKKEENVHQERTWHDIK